MLFDGTLRFMDAPNKGLDEVAFTKRYADDNNNRIRSQNIVVEFQGSLVMSGKGDLPGTLYRLYDFVVYQLQQANLKKDAEPMDNAHKTMSELREAGEEMLSQNQEGLAGEPGSISMKA